MRPDREALDALDGALYVVTDRDLAQGRTHIEVTEAALRGGARVIQLRDKTATPHRLIYWGARMRKMCEERDATFVVNDRLDIARELKAHCLHLGQSDLSIAEARPKWGGILGASASTVEQAVRAERDGADYVGLGPIWSTPTKTDADSPCGLECITMTREAVDFPVVAIGGINLKNIANVIRAGAHSAAVISAVVAVEDVEAATRQLVETMGGARRGI